MSTLTPDERPKAMEPWGLWHPIGQCWWRVEYCVDDRPWMSRNSVIDYAKRWLRVSGFNQPLIVARIDDPLGHECYRVTRDGVERIEAEKKGEPI